MTQAILEFVQAQTQILPVALVPEIDIHQVTDMMPLWQFTEDSLRQANLPPPFWAIAWPGGQGLARYLLDTPSLVMGKRILDFAAGSGVAAIAAMKAGARSALAVDIDAVAIQAMTLNAALNGVCIGTRTEVDLTKPFKETDVILAGDICYQQSMSTTLVRWLRLCVEAGVVVLLSDPGRAYVPEDGLVELASYDVPTSLEIEDKEIRTVTVWRLENTFSQKD